MTQLTFATTGFEPYRKTTRREVFLAEMNQVVPWEDLCAVIEPVYPQPAGAGRRPVGVERMVRIYFLQQWFNLSDPAVEEALYDSTAMRAFVGIDLGREPVPDEPTVCRFRHRLETHQLGVKLFETVQSALGGSGEPDVDQDDRGRDDHYCPQFDEECGPGPGSRDASDGQGQAVVLRDEGACGGGQRAEADPLGGGHRSQRGR